MLSIRPLIRHIAVPAKSQPQTITCSYSAASFPKRSHREKQREARAISRRPTGTTSPSTPPTPPLSIPPPLNAASSNFPFNVRRSKSNNLPVYHQISHNESLKLTRIRNVSGNREALKDLIMQRLGLPKEDVVINNRTEHIMVRGLVRNEILALLEEMGA